VVFLYSIEGEKEREGKKKKIGGGKEACLLIPAAPDGGAFTFQGAGEKNYSGRKPGMRSIYQEQEREEMHER